MTIEKMEALTKLYEAVNVYCEKSKETKGPISDGYWNRVLIAWNEVKKVMENGS